MENQDWALLSVLWLLVAYSAALTVLTMSVVWVVATALLAMVAAVWGLARQRHRKARPTSSSSSSLVGSLTEREG